MVTARVCAAACDGGRILKTMAGHHASGRFAGFAVKRLMQIDQKARLSRAGDQWRVAYTGNCLSASHQGSA
jgi:hypothetical protein